MQHQSEDPTRRRFEELLEARKAGSRPGGGSAGDPRQNDRPAGRPAPATAARTFRRRKV